MNKRIIIFSLCAWITFSMGGCRQASSTAPIVATTLPVYNLTSYLCQDTGLPVQQLVSEPVSCLHNYTLQVSQMQTAESADVMVMTGAGYEGFLSDVIDSTSRVIDASSGIDLLPLEHGHSHDLHEADSQDTPSEDSSNEGHNHSHDAHIWMSPKNAKIMAENIYDGLVLYYPEKENTFHMNLQSLMRKLDELQAYGEEQFSDLSCQDMITFHDGFHYMAQSFGLNIVRSIEEEPGSEISAAELKELIVYVKEHHLPAIFTEKNGSSASAKVIAAETGCSVYSLDMVMYGRDYFEAMYYNIDTIKEALG